MTFERIALLRNVGQFDSVSAGAQIPLGKLTLIYAENGRGKTTIAAILRSLSTGDPGLITDRHRLGSAQPPHIVLNVAGQPSAMFQNGAWSAPLPHVAVFDDAFVAANVCSGIEIAAEHRQNLHELILGAQGVSLNAALQAHITRVEEHNRTLRQKQDAIPASVRGTLTVDAFCALSDDPGLHDKTQEAERALAAARAADAIRQQAQFATITLPAFDIKAINTILARTLPDLEAEAGTQVRAHLRKLGYGGEAWISDGMARISRVSEGMGRDVCPFCVQPLEASSLIRHYQAYFSGAYEGLRQNITVVGQGIGAAHSGEVQAAFERDVRVAVQARIFWSTFIDAPDIDIDTATITQAWIAARDAVLTALRAKAAAPFEASALATEAIALVEAYDRQRLIVEKLSASLGSCNGQIAIVKEKAATANVATLTSDLTKLLAIAARHSSDMSAACDSYAAEKAAKTATERLRDQSRSSLDQYRQTVFPAYERAINTYLQRFNAGFRLGSVTSVNSRSGSSVNYSVLINNVAVTLTAEGGPAFRNTLSAGDRNTLALAFFFASLEHDPNLSQKIVVIDDPMTSLDEHRSLTTVQEMRRLFDRVDQMIVLSHSKPFLCALWQGADTSTRTAVRIARSGAGSTLAAWDPHNDCITEHDRRHQLVRAYVNISDPAKEREVATALRPILEAFMRVAYPDEFPPGTMLGHFHNICQQKLGSPSEVLSDIYTTELRSLLDYANHFHHDTNPAWQTTAINDQELLDFAQRTLSFASRN